MLACNCQEYEIYKDENTTVYIKMAMKLHGFYNYNGKYYILSTASNASIAIPITSANLEYHFLRHPP